MTGSAGAGAAVAAAAIDGATRLYAIIGDPIVQVRSPAVYTAIFAEAGLNAVLVPAHVPAARFDEVVPALLALANLDGLLVTAPFKSRMLPFADSLGATASCIGALNALRREPNGTWSGDMFDGIGFVRGAERKGHRLAGRRVRLFGAGGAGSAVACALADVGIASLAIVDPQPERAAALAAALFAVFPRCDITVGPGADPDMIVNASPVGMKPDDGLPGDIGLLTPDILVGDVVIVNPPTALIRLAEEKRCAWVDGRDMHAGQAQALMGFLAPEPANG